MSIVDDRGRLLGKVNLIDGIVALFVLLLVPLGYGAYVLFRMPPPKITSFEPSTFVSGQEQHIEIRGEHFRPYLKARVGDNIEEFLVASPVIGEIKVRPLALGTYDLSLYDEAQELVRLPNAITVTQRVDPEITSLEPSTLTPSLAQRIEIRGENLRPYLDARVGNKNVAFLLQSPFIGEIKVPPLELGTYDLSLYDGAQELVRLPNAITVTVPPGPKVRRVRQGRITMVVQFVVRPELFDLVQPGAMSLRLVEEQEQNQNAGMRKPAESVVPKHRATLVSISNQQTLRSLVSIGLDPDPARPNGVYHQVEQMVTTFDGVVEATVDDLPSGWRFNGQMVKPGGVFSFETRDYTIRGWILKVEQLEQRTSKATP